MANKKSARSRSASPAINPAAQAFSRLVSQLSYKGKPSRVRLPLENITFWAGAGFSKSWDTRSPTGAELFTVPMQELESALEQAHVARLLGNSAVENTIDFDAFQQIVYTLDMHERHPEIRSRYFDAYNIAHTRTKLQAAITARFNRLVCPTFFNNRTEKITLLNPSPSQERMLYFFSRLSKHADGSSGSAEGVRYHFLTTNYDWVIETILDNIIGPDDSHFLYTYRGVTPNRIEGFPLGVQTHNHWLVQKLLKINGGFEVLPDAGGYRFDYTDRKLSDIQLSPPNIILPSREQIYTDAYFKEVFSKAVRLLRDSKVLVIVGYSMPREDTLLRFIIRQFAEEAEDGVGKHLFYIDMATVDQMRTRVEEVFPSVADFQFPIVHFFQGSFDTFAGLCAPLL